MSLLGNEKARLATYLPLYALTCSFDAVTGLYNICFQADGSRRAMELEEEATGIAQDCAGLITTPEWSG